MKFSTRIVAVSASVLAMAAVAPSVTNSASAASRCKGSTCTTDTTKPIISISSPSASATVAGQVSVSGTSSDNVGVSSVSLSVDGGTWVAATGTSSWTAGWNSTVVANGTHTLTAKAVDTSGNYTTQSISVNVSNATADTTAPTVSISSPTAGATVGGTVSLAGTAGDNAAVAKVETSVDGGTWVTASGTSSWTSSWNSTSVANGTHTVTARATDTSGNVKTTQTSISVSNSTADTTKPTISIWKPANGGTASGTVQAYGVTSDNVAVAAVDISVDGGAWQRAEGVKTWFFTWQTAALPNGTHTFTARATDTSGNTTTVTSTVTTSQPTTCNDGTAVLSRYVSPEGLVVRVCTTVGGWTADSIYNLVKPNARDLNLVGPLTTIDVTTSGPSSEGTSASCCTDAGNYYGYRATIQLNPSSTSTFGVYPDAIAAHEYGHAWTGYWLYMNKANAGKWDNYIAARGLTGDSRVGSSYAWMPTEMSADDYRRLFGTPAAQTEMPYINSAIPDSQQIAGLATFFTNNWAVPQV